MTSKRSILVINPNTTTAMTDALRPLIDDLGFMETTPAYFTAPSGPSSINSESDAAASTEHCLPHLKRLLCHHDAFLVACYSQHPLVPALKSLTNKPVIGIFEASVLASLGLLKVGQSFGIVTTGKIWESLLTKAVSDFLGSEGSSSQRFKGVETTGLNATELHDAPTEEVKNRIQDATKRLARRGNVGAICLGCAGMSEMDKWVGEAAQEEGQQDVKIIDGVLVGFSWLEGALRYSQ